MISCLRAIRHLQLLSLLVSGKMSGGGRILHSCGWREISWNCKSPFNNRVWTGITGIPRSPSLKLSLFSTTTSPQTSLSSQSNMPKDEMPNRRSERNITWSMWVPHQVLGSQSVKAEWQQSRKAEKSQYKVHWIASFREMEAGKRGWEKLF